MDRATVHHSSPIYVKRNILASTFIPHPLLSQQEFSHYVLDNLVFGNAFLEKRFNQLGEVMRLECSPAYTRRKYYQKGAPAGYIMYVTNAAQSNTPDDGRRA